MASPTFISAVALTPGTSASPGAQSLTVPSDAQGVIVLTFNYAGAGANLSLSSNFAGTFTILQDAGTQRASVSHAVVTSTGSKTLTPSWTNAIEEGPMFWVVFVKNVDTSSTAAWIRDTFAEGGESSGQSISDNLSTAADDLIIVLDSLYDGGVPGPPANPSGWTSQGTQDLNLEASRLRTLIATGGPTTTVTANGAEWRGLSAISVIGTAGGTSYSLTCDTGAYTLTGETATTSRGVRMTGDVGSYSLTGQNATTSRGYSITGDTGAYSLTGVAAGTQAGFRLVSDTGAYSLTGQDATLTYSQGTTNYTLTAETGDYTLTGVDAGTTAGRRLVADVGAYSLTGQSATTSKGTRLVADVGTYTLTGQDATLTATATVNYTLICETGDYVLGEVSAELIGPQRRQGGGRPTRKGYIIKGQRYWLDDMELAVLIAQMLSEVKRADVQEVKDDKPKVLSRRTWLKLKASLKALEDLAEVPQDDDDEDEALMLLLM